MNTPAAAKDSKDTKPKKAAEETAKPDIGTLSDNELASLIETAQAEPGNQVTFVWGEEGGGSQKPTVERHKQAEIRATVAPVPYADPARKDYRVNS